MEEIRAMIGELRGQLEKAFQDGINPFDERVRGIESKISELEEGLRLMKASGVPGEARGTTEPNFGGMFLRNVEEIRNVLRAGGAEARGVDSSLFATGGKLNPEQSSNFIDYIVNEAVALSRVQVRRMNAPQATIDELTGATRKLRRGVENTAPAGVQNIGTRKRTLTTVETILPEDITLSFLEDNIERKGAENHIVKILATMFGNDLNDLAWNGDEAAATGDVDFVTINDGWLKIIAAAVIAGTVDATGATSPGAVLASLRKHMPSKFKARTDLVYFAPVPFVEAYAEELAGRETGLGDQIVVNGLPAVRYFGNLVVGDPALQSGEVIFTPEENLVVGIQRDMTVDSMYQPRKRAVEYTIAGRSDFEIVTGEAIVRAHNLPASMK